MSDTEQAKSEHSGDLCEKFLQKEKTDRVRRFLLSCKICSNLDFCHQCHQLVLMIIKYPRNEKVPEYGTFSMISSMRLDLNQRPLRVVPVPEIQYLCGFSGTHFETQPLTQPPQILIWLSNTMRRRKFTASIRPGEIRVCSCLDPLVILHR